MVNKSVTMLSTLSGFSYRNCFLVIGVAAMLYFLSYIFKAFIDDDGYELSKDGYIKKTAPSMVSMMASFISLGLIILSICLFVIGAINIGPRSVSDLKHGVHSSSNGFIKNMVGEETLVATSESLGELGIKGNNFYEITENTKRASDKQTQQIKNEIRKAADMIQY